MQRGVHWQYSACVLRASSSGGGRSTRVVGDESLSCLRKVSPHGWPTQVSTMQGPRCKCCASASVIKISEAPGACCDHLILYLPPSYSPHESIVDFPALGGVRLFYYKVVIALIPLVLL